MCLLLVVLLGINSNEKSVEVRFTEIAPKIDGVIDEIWQMADSAYDFIQSEPYENEPPTERTVVYVLQDKENLYFAFRCYAQNHQPIACFTKDEDYVTVKIDPFGSKTHGYYFTVFASRLFWDGWILDDGRTEDDSWEGVWYRGVALYDDRLEVEIKIPFKSIRYKKGFSQWGVQFRRYIAANRESDYWTEVLQKEDDMVSKWRQLTGINPQATGYYFELYPEGYIRRDRNYRPDTTKFKPSISLNFKWDVTPQMTLNATTYPDFAQIESDPFTLNLDRFPVYLDERRPFFLEGKDIFRMFDFGEGKGFFDPLEIFYSRRIGKSMNGDAVPIIGGLKLTNKSEDLDVGALGAYTNEYADSANAIEEPHRWFGVFRGKHRVLGNSDIGVLLTGTMVDENDYNYALGLDGAYRRGANQFIVQGAVSDHNEKRGWAFKSGFFGFIGNFGTLGSFEVLSDSFDVNDIGFVPWAGQTKLLLLSGPFKQYPTGFLQHLFIAPGILIIQEPGDTNWSTLGAIEINPGFRNNWGSDFSIIIGPYYEADTNYLYRGLDLSIWGPLFGNHLNFSCHYFYTYNYWRGFLAYRGSNNLSYNYSIIPQMSVGFESDLWIEWDTTNTIIAITPRLKPKIDIKFNADMSLSIFSELVMETPGTDFDNMELLSNRLGLLFSWNFMPKSWLYIALNDYREQEDGELAPQYRIGAIKAKYLVYF